MKKRERTHLRGSWIGWKLPTRSAWNRDAPRGAGGDDRRARLETQACRIAEKHTDGSWSWPSVPSCTTSPAPAAPTRLPRLRSMPRIEVEAARGMLGMVDGPPQVELLAPERVNARRWSARHESSFTEDSFAALKHDIAHTGGNLVPALVRRLWEVEGYELVYGERRLRACMALGLPLHAIVTSMTDHEAARARAAECRYGAWTAFERGTLFGRMPRTGLYPSRRRLAEDLGLTLTEVADDIRVAELPAPVLAAFHTPTQVRVSWAKKLAAALTQDPDMVLTAATSLTGGQPRKAAAQVYATLTASPLRGVLRGNSNRRATVRASRG